MERNKKITIPDGEANDISNDLNSPWGATVSLEGTYWTYPGTSTVDRQRIGQDVLDMVVRRIVG